MTLKLFTPAEIKQANEKELAKDILRTKSIKDALAKSTTELNDVSARFELALANQRVRWQQEEDEAKGKLAEIEQKIRAQESRVIPIEPNSEEVHNLYEQAKKLKAEAEEMIKDSEDVAVAFQDRLDALYEKEEEINIREQKIQVKEKAIAGQENMVKNLSKELDLKWKEYFKTINQK